MYKNLFILTLVMTFFITQNSFAQSDKANKEIEKTNKEKQKEIRKA